MRPALAKQRMAVLFGLLMVFFLCSSFLCNKVAVKPGENRLTIDLRSNGRKLNAPAKVYLNGKFIGMTDVNNGRLVVNLQRGEYALRVELDGYEPWSETILMLGGGHKQQVIPDLKRRR